MSTTPSDVPRFAFPTDVTREQVRDALDRIATPRDREVLAAVIDNAAAAYLAITTEAREERATNRVQLRELASGLERAIALVPDDTSTDQKAELNWLRLIAQTAMGEDPR